MANRIKKIQKYWTTFHYTYMCLMLTLFIFYVDLMSLMFANWLFLYLDQSLW